MHLFLRHPSPDVSSFSSSLWEEPVTSTRHKARRSQGFSLIELSIVLVILGLLTGGILTGQSLIRAAELRSINTEYQRYITGTQTFRDKYMAIPGDMNNATRFWNRLSTTGCTTNSSATTDTTNGVCDGDGDGMVETATTASQSGERYQFWRQMSRAGLIEGTYSGVAGTAVDTHTSGSNCPATRISPQSCWSVLWRGNSSGVTNDYFAGDYGNFLVFANGATTSPILKPEEAWNIDTKLDDGKPGLGKVMANIQNCTNAASGSASATSADYTLTTNTQVCTLFFTRAF